MEAAFCEDVQRTLRQCRLGSYPRDWVGPELERPHNLQRRLNRWMPDVEVGLERHARFAGRRVKAATLRAAIASRSPGFARGAVFMCKNLRSADPNKRGRPYLYEVRVCIDDDGPEGRPQTLLDCATVARREQGCGERFWIDDV